MPSPNLDLVRSIYADWECGDFGSAGWADPEIEFVIVDGPEPGAWMGLAAMAEGIRSWISAWSDWRVEPDEYRELDADQVLVLSHNIMRGTASGLELGQMQSKTGVLFHVRGGRVSRLVIYLDREHALA